MSKRSLRRHIKEGNYDIIIDVIKKDINNKLGCYLYKIIPADEEWDHVFEVYEEYYDCSKAYYRYVNRESITGNKVKYESVEGVIRREPW